MILSMSQNILALMELQNILQAHKFLFLHSSTFKKYGNTGSAALPTALSLAIDNDFIKVGHRTVLLGIGSGLNSTMIGVSRI